MFKNKPRLLFKLTSRSRPQRFFHAIENIITSVSKDCNYKIHCTLDSGDVTMYNPYILERLKNYPVEFTYGVSKNKIDAINRDINTIDDWDVLINMSDDMRFTLHGFNNLIEQEFMNGTDVCLHIPDENQKDNLITLAVLGKEYYDRFGYIYHPSYKSLWCDVEMTDVAKKLGKYKYVPMIFVKHMHPAWGYQTNDDQYRFTEGFNSVDHKNYLTRKANDFK